MRLLAFCLLFFTTIGNAEVSAKPALSSITVLSTTNITSGAYLQLVASMPQCESLQVFNSSAVPIDLAVGGAGNEQILLADFPPSPSLFTRFNLMVKQGSRLSAKAIGATANTGYFIVVCLQ